MNNVCGTARSGKLTAILDSTALGRSVLLQILTGRIELSKTKKLSGTVRINGRLRDESWRHRVAFCEANYQACMNMSVDEVLAFQVNIRLGKTFTHAEKRAILDFLFEKLELEPVRYKRTGSFIKGCKLEQEILKLISIANLLLEFPIVAILEDPTANMDSAHALCLIEFLKDFCARTGMTAVMSIHQPRREIWESFDAVSVLFRGRTLFHGRPSACKEHFEAVFKTRFSEASNPADCILDLLTSKKITTEFDTIVNASFIENHTLPAEVPLTSKPEKYKLTDHLPNSFWGEFGLLYGRFRKIYFRETRVIIFEVTQAILLSLLIAFVYFQLDTTSKDAIYTIGLFYFITSAVFTTIGIPASSNFSGDSIFFVRERAAGSYRMFTAYLAKYGHVTPYSTGLMFLFAIPIYFISGLAMPFYKLIAYLGVLLALRMFGLTLRICFTATFKAAGALAVVMPFMIIFFILFGDLSGEPGQVTWILAWIKYLTPLYYAVQALVQNQFAGETYQSDMNPNLTVDGQYYVNQNNFNQISYWFCMLALIGFAVLYFVLGFVALSLRTRTKLVLI